MKLIVGLGNPGERYRRTRHNVGFETVDVLGSKYEVASWKSSKKGKLQYVWIDVNGEKVELIKPQSFMNESGYSVAYVCSKHRDLQKKDIYVIHDDLDIKLGEYKIQLGKGPRKHNGLLSIYEKLGTSDFWHVRVGIENRIRTTDYGLQHNISGEKYVLQKFSEKDLKILNPVIDKIVKDVIGNLTEHQSLKTSN